MSFDQSPSNLSCVLYVFQFIIFPLDLNKNVQQLMKEILLIIFFTQFLFLLMIYNLWKTPFVVNFIASVYKTEVVNKETK